MSAALADEDEVERFRSAVRAFAAQLLLGRREIAEALAPVSRDNKRSERVMRMIRARR